LKITVSKPKYYRRNAELFEIIHKPKKHHEFLLQSQIQSEQPNSFWFEKTSRVKNFAIVISNDDNATLEIERIKAFQWNRTLTAYFEKGTSYTLMIGNDSVNFPVYDLGNFKNKISSKINFVKVAEPVKTATNRPAEETGFSFLNNKLFVWIAIGVVILFLGYISIKMLKEMK
jgi:hypothetical protein